MKTEKTILEFNVGKGSETPGPSRNASFFGIVPSSIHKIDLYEAFGSDYAPKSSLIGWCDAEAVDG